jgi:hypothetical protein
MGLQSASKETLRFYKRPGNADLYRKKHDLIQKYPGMVFPYYDVIGDNPLVDAEADMVGTIEFLLSLKGNFTLLVYSLRMYPGTELWNQAKEAGLDESYFMDSYLNADERLLNYILQIMQCTRYKFIPRALLKLYRRVGNIEIPHFLFALNRFAYIFRLGLEHIRRGDISGLPRSVVRLLNPLGVFKRRPKTIRTVKLQETENIPGS